MTNFVDKHQGSSHVSWGNVVAGASVTGGVLLAGTAIGGMLDVPLANDVYQQSGELIDQATQNLLSTSKEVTEEAVNTAKTIASEASDITEKTVEVATETAATISAPTIESIQADAVKTNLEPFIKEVSTAIASTPIGDTDKISDLVQVLADSKATEISKDPAWDSIIDIIKSSSPSELIAQLEIAQQESAITNVPMDAVIETAKLSSPSDVVANVEALRDAMVNSVNNIDSNAIEEAYKNAAAGTDPAAAATDQLQNQIDGHITSLTEVAPAVIPELPIQIDLNNQQALFDIVGDNFISQFAQAEAGQDILPKIANAVPNAIGAVGDASARVGESVTQGAMNFWQDTADHDVVSKVQMLGQSEAIDTLTPAAEASSSAAQNLVSMTSEQLNNSREGFSKFIGALSTMNDAEIDIAMEIMPDAYSKAVENMPISESAKQTLLHHINNINWSELGESISQAGSKQQAVQAVNSQLGGALSDDIISQAADTTSAVSTVLDPSVEPSAEQTATPLKTAGKYGMLATGAALGLGGAAYKATHGDAQTLAYDAPVDFSRMENAKMGFAANEKMRAVNALMQARQQALGGAPAPGQGIA